MSFMFCALQMEPYNTCVYLDMDNAPHDFDAVTRVIGEKVSHVTLLIDFKDGDDEI